MIYPNFSKNFIRTQKKEPKEDIDCGRSGVVIGS